MSRVGFALIHGAGLGSWIWDRVVPELKAPALAVDFPRRGDSAKGFGKVRLEQYVQEVSDQLSAFDVEKMIFVGHSIGGEIALRIATLQPEWVREIVFVSAVVPASGSSMVLIDPRLEPLAMRVAQGSGPVRPPDRVIGKVACNDLDDETKALVLRRYVHESLHLFVDPIEWSVPASVPKLYVRTTKDLSLLPAFQDKMIVNAQPVRVVEMETGHLPMLSKAKQLAGYLNEVLQAFGGN